MRPHDELTYEREYAARPALSAARVAFIRRTYAHLAGAILAFIGVEAGLVYAVSQSPELQGAFFSLFRGWGILLVFLAFMGASFLAQAWARSRTSVALQYAGLALFVVAEAVIMLPLLYIATFYVRDPALIPTAGLLTLCVFGGLTLTVFVTGKDFSFLSPVLMVGSLVAFGVIIAGVIFGFGLGLFFSFAMVALLAGYILFETSQVMLTYPTDMHVSAALFLFSSVATLFWYILRILMILNNGRN